MVASRYEVSLKTANGWLTGQIPRLEHFIGVSDDLGPAFMANVVGSAAGWAHYLAFGASLEDCVNAISRLNADLEGLVPVVRRERLRK